MLKYIHKLTVLTVILLLISAFTMCPAMAEHVTSTSSSVPSIDTSQAIRDLSIDENDVFYVFTVDGQQGIVHERKLGDEDGGLSRVEDVIIGDQCAALVSDTPEQTIVAITGGYLLTFDKNQKLITLSDSQSQGSNEEEALVIAANEQIDEALVSVTQSKSDSDGDSWLSIIASLVPFSAQTIVKAGTLVCLTCVNPMLGAGYFVSTCLVGLDEANPVVIYGLVEATVFVIAVGAIALALSNGQNYGSIDIDAIKNFFDDKGVAHFVIFRDGHYYKYKYDKNAQNPKAEYLGEVNVIEGIFTMAAGEVLICNGEIIQKVKDVTESITSYIQVGLNDLRERFHLAPLYYRLNGKYHHVKEINFAKGVELMKRCDNKDENGTPVWIGSTEEGCKELAKKATEEMGGEWDKDNLKENSGTQPWHYHAKHPTIEHCGAHCFWDYLNFFKLKNSKLSKKTDL